MLPQKSSNFLASLEKLRKLEKAFEKVGFAADAYLGHLTTSPMDLGTGLTLKANIGNLIASQN